MHRYEYSVDETLTNNTAASVYRLARSGGKRILDVGGGPGMVSGALARAEGKHCVIVDNDVDALAQAADSGLLVTVRSDVEAQSWTGEIPEGQWDTIILADVLEHLRNPGKVLEDIRDASLLARDGQLVISFPNAAHQAVLAELLCGDFRYTETGLLDDTHIQWFTLVSMTRLLAQHGFAVEAVERTVRTLEQTGSRSRSVRLNPTQRQAIAESSSESLVYQYILKAVPDDQISAQVLEFEERIEALESAVLDSGRAASAMQRRLAAAESLLREQQISTVEELRLAGEELDRAAARADRERQKATNEREKLLAQLAGHRDRLRAVELSRSYRVGRGVRLLVHPGEAARALRRRWEGS